MLMEHALVSLKVHSLKVLVSGTYCMAAGPWKGPRRFSAGWGSGRRKRLQRPWPEGESLKTPTPSPVIADLPSTDQKSANAGEAWMFGGSLVGQKK